jgi:hypothetical protein
VQVLDITINFYTDAEKDQLKSERKKEMQGLVKAFSYLDKDSDGRIDFRSFRAMLSHLRPDLSKFEVRLLHDISATRIDPYDPLNPPTLDVVDFLSIRKILGVRFAQRSLKRTQLKAFAELLFESRWYNIVIRICHAINGMLLASKASGWNVQFFELTHVLCLAVMVADIVFQSVHLGFINYMHLEGTASTIITVAQNVLTRFFVHFLPFFPEVAALLSPERIQIIVNVSDGLTAYVAMNQVPTLHKWMWTFLKMVPMLFDVSCFVFMNLYALTVILLELGLFDEPFDALLLTFRILLGSDWSGDMLRLVQIHGYFCSTKTNFTISPQCTMEFGTFKNCLN